MAKIDIKTVFQCLCAFEYNLLNYINRTQGEASAPLNYFEAATALCSDKNSIRKALRRLVESKALIVEGENFKINEELFKNE